MFFKVNPRREQREGEDTHFGAHSSKRGRARDSAGCVLLFFVPVFFLFVKGACLIKVACIVKGACIVKRGFALLCFAFFTHPFQVRDYLNRNTFGHVGILTGSAVEFT